MTTKNSLNVAKNPEKGGFVELPGIKQVIESHLSDVTGLRDRIITVLKEDGPMLGRDLVRIVTGYTPEHYLDESGTFMERKFFEQDIAERMWAVARTTDEIREEMIGKRYFKLPKEGKAQVEPSIVNEFLDFTVIGLEGDKRFEEEVSKQKKILQSYNERWANIIKGRVGPLSRYIDTEYFFALAGSTASGMAHDRKRVSERGRIVEGSDIDVVALLARPTKVVALLDPRAMVSGTLHGATSLVEREFEYQHDKEVEFTVVTMQEMKTHIGRLDDRESFLLCKAFQQSQFLTGNKGMYEGFRKTLEQSGLPEKMRNYEGETVKNREEQEVKILTDAIHGIEKLGELEDTGLWTKEQIRQFVGILASLGGIPPDFELAFINKDTSPSLIEQDREKKTYTINMGHRRHSPSTALHAATHLGVHEAKHDRIKRSTAKHGEYIHSKVGHYEDNEVTKCAEEVMAEAMTAADPRAKTAEVYPAFAKEGYEYAKAHEKDFNPAYFAMMDVVCRNFAQLPGENARLLRDVADGYKTLGKDSTYHNTLAKIFNEVYGEYHEKTT